MIEYFKELEEESIRDNFVIIYELLDELIDFGYPQTTDSKILQEYVQLELFGCTQLPLFGFWCAGSPAFNSHFGFASFIFNLKVHYPRRTQVRSGSATSNGSNQCSILEIRGNQVPKE